MAVVITLPAVLRHFLRLLRKTDGRLSPELAAIIVPGQVGMAFSFVCGLAALRLLSAVPERGHWRYFG